MRVEATITQLVFEHSLRIRMKADTQDEAKVEIVVSSTPDSASVAATQPEASESETLHSVFATESTVLAESVDEPTKPKGDGEEGGSSSANNLVGKINNMVTTDLGNIIESKDFLFIAVSLPFQVSLCIFFLYQVLGWR